MIGAFSRSSHSSSGVHLEGAFRLRTSTLLGAQHLTYTAGVQSHTHSCILSHTQKYLPPIRLSTKQLFDCMKYGDNNVFKQCTTVIFYAKPRPTHTTPNPSATTPTYQHPPLLCLLLAGPPLQFRQTCRNFSAVIG